MYMFFFENNHYWLHYQKAKIRYIATLSMTPLSTLSSLLSSTISLCQYVNQSRASLVRLIVQTEPNLSAQAGTQTLNIFNGTDSQPMAAQACLCGTPSLNTGISMEQEELITDRESSQPRQGDRVNPKGTPFEIFGIICFVWVVLFCFHLSTRSRRYSSLAGQDSVHDQCKQTCYGRMKNIGSCNDLNFSIKYIVLADMLKS